MKRPLMLLMCVAGVVQLPARGQTAPEPILFNAARSFLLSNAPVAMVAADFNGDGNMDLAVANSSGASASVLLGNGDGTFGDPVRSTGSGAFGAMAVGDFNGDLRPDLAITDVDGVTVLIGAGDDAFVTATNYATPFIVEAIQVGDFNLDGKLDLVAAYTNYPDAFSANDNLITFFLGNGDGTFRTAALYCVGFEPNSLVVADFNNDGKPDLATVNLGADTVSVSLGRGDGTFADPATLGVGYYPVAIASGDFNGDGKRDLAITRFFDDSVLVLSGNGDGTFVSTTNYAVGRRPRTLLISDYNQDGRLDLITINALDRTLSLLAGNGDGTFVRAVDVNLGMACLTGVVGEFNGDGQPDIAIVSPNVVGVLLNQTHIALQAVRDGGPIKLAWPAYASGFVLESTAELSLTAGWVAVTNAFSVIGDRRVVTDRVASGNKFFRLKHR